MKRTILSIKEKAAIALVLFALAFAPASAYAQCEMPGTTAAVANGLAQGIKAALKANYYCVKPIGGGFLCTAWQVSTTAAMKVTNDALKAFETALYTRLRKFWDDYLKALQDMTAQLNSSLVDGSRGLSNLMDTGEMTRNQRTLQSIEVSAKKLYVPTDEGCRFDTAGSKLGSTNRISRVMQQSIGKYFSDVGGNFVDPAAPAGTPMPGKGPAALHAIRWANWYGLFCDASMNGGHSGCPGANPDGTNGTTQELANANVNPAKTLFGKETIPYNATAATGVPTAPTTGVGWKVATDELIFNLTGYQAPQPIPSDGLQAASLKDRRAETRAYSTQMDVVVSLVSGIVAERTPGETSTDIQQLRQSNGITDANDKPSEREIRQSVLEQLWNPNYYVNLQDSSSATARKEVYLKAFNLMLLYKLIDRTERIANAFVVETGNMIDTYQGDKMAGQISSTPIRP